MALLDGTAATRRAPRDSCTASQEGEEEPAVAAAAAVPAAAAAPAPRARRTVRWAAGVASPEPTREMLHRRARTADLPIPWRDPVNMVKLRRAGETTLEHALDWVAMADVRAELRPGPESASSAGAPAADVCVKRKRCRS